jgi:hypothetical protein
MTNTAKNDVKPKLPERKRRTSVAGPRNILTVHDKDPNYFYRFVRNDEGRITWFKDRGYEVVSQPTQVGDKTVDSGTQLGSAVTKHGGGNVTLVLMRIPREWYDEDQAAKEAEIAAVEATMKRPSSELGAGAYGGLNVITRK